MSTRTVRLSDVAEVRLGRQRSPANHDGPKMRKYVRAANITWEGLELDDVKSMNFEDAEMEQYRLRPGDILLTEGSGSAAEVGKPALWAGEIDDCAFQNTLIRVRPFGIDARYLLHYFRQQARQGGFARGSRGVGIRHLGQATLAGWQVPLPPPAEQHRTVEVLDDMDLQLVKRRRTTALLAELVGSVFAEMFGDPEGDNRGWPERELRTILRERPTYGTMIPATESKRTRLCLRVANIHDWRVNLRSRRYVDLPEECVERHALEDGDVVLARAIGSLDHLGKAVVVDTGGDRWAFDSHLMRLRLDHSKVEPVFLQSLLQSPGGRRRFLAIARRSLVQFNVNTREIGRLRVPTPPINLQRQYVSRVKQVATAERRQKRHLDYLDALSASLQHRAFRGELWPDHQD